MNGDATNPEATRGPTRRRQSPSRLGYDFGLSRRGFVQVLGAGTAGGGEPHAGAGTAGRRAGRRPGRAHDFGARIHFGKDGTITVLTGKVEAGQGARAELSQAAAEELRVPASRIQLLMSDTGLMPDDGITAGSGSTPRTVPAVRRGAAAAREALVDFACRRWGVEPAAVEVRDGKAVHAPTQRALSYADLAASEDAPKAPGTAHSRRRGLHAGEAMEGAGPAHPPAQRARHRDRRAQVSFGHHPARHALRQSPAPARLRRKADGHRPWPGQGDEGRGGGAGRPVCGRGCADDLPGGTGAGGHCQDGAVGARPASVEQGTLCLSQSKTPEAACRPTRSRRNWPRPNRFCAKPTGGIHPARAAGTARRGRGMGGREADRLDRLAKSLWLPLGTGAGLPSPGGSGAGHCS